MVSTLALGPNSHPTDNPYASSAVATPPATQPLEEAQQAADNSVSGQRNQLNAQILQASLDVSIKAGDESLTLLYRSAIDHINEVLAPELGPNALQGAMQQDNSPEGTAGRILSMSTAFFDAYAKQHPGQDSETLVQNFVDTIRGGFEKGYAEASKILQGLGVMEAGSDIAAGIQKTYDLVMKGYDDFTQKKIAELSTSTNQPKDNTQSAAEQSPSALAAASAQQMR